MSYDEFIGITQRVDHLIERNRIAPDETKCEILSRVLGGNEPLNLKGKFAGLDLGQGVQLNIGEKLYLFLRKKQDKPEAIAEVTEDGLCMDGQKIIPSKGSFIHPAMQIVQRRLNNRNRKGLLISLSAWRQWHVLRDGRFVKLFDLKDPTKAKKRLSPSVVPDPNFNPDDLGL
jgi:hypothetical protein